MPRVKRGTASRKRHKRLLKSTSGYVAGQSRTIRRATEAKLHARKHAQKHRRMKKRDFRGIWIARINNALRQIGNVTYATFMHRLQMNNIHLDRKTLAYLADQAPEVFRSVVKSVMGK
jgi:large subunit ribosomal protein L20